jgi:hypothetical protein
MYLQLSLFSTAVRRGCRLGPANDSAGGQALGTAALVPALGLLRRRRLGR